MALSPREMEVAIIANLEAKTGKNLDDWLALVRAAPSMSTRDTAQWLASEHHLGFGTARLIAVHATQGTSVYVDEQALFDRVVVPALRPMFARIETVLRDAAPDVSRIVCTTYVGFRNGKRQFAVVREVSGVLVVALALGATNHGLAKTRFRGGGRMTHELAVPGTEALTLLATVATAAAGEAT
jgi:hypothetical protein